MGSAAVSDQIEPGTIVEVVRQGFSIGELVLRYAQVKVAASPSEGESTGESQQDASESGGDAVGDGGGEGESESEFEEGHPQPAEGSGDEVAT